MTISKAQGKFCKLGSSSGRWLCSKAHPLSFSSSLLLASLMDSNQFVHLAHLLCSEGIITLVASEAREIAKKDGNCLSLNH